METWRQQPGMLGLRFALVQPHQRAWWTDGTLDWLWPAAERAGIPVALLAGEFLPVVARVATRHPGLKLMIDHLGRTGGQQDEPAFGDLPDLLALARYPNVAVKATGAPSYSSAPYPYRNIHSYVRQVYDAFGPRRLFWGSDITRMPCSWRQCITLFTEELPWLTNSDKELIMGRAVCDWLGWQRR
jgi:predicted TIM-barrel fold metal-dependent hydrolase